MLIGLSGCQTARVPQTLGLAATPTSENGYRKVIILSFTTASNYTWKASSTIPTIKSVEMTYGTGVTNANTFTLNYTRNGILREMLSVAGTMHTLTWYVPSDYYMLEGDIWSWSNSAAGAAVLTVNCDYQY